MQSIIEVFRMNEISPQTRADIISKLGELINHEYACNITEPLVYELIKQLVPNHPRIAQLEKSLLK